MLNTDSRMIYARLVSCDPLATSYTLLLSCSWQWGWIVKICGVCCDLNWFLRSTHTCTRAYALGRF